MTLTLQARVKALERASRNVDPPRLDNYLTARSPQCSGDTNIVLKNAPPAPKRNRINEATTPKASSEDVRATDTGLIEDSGSSPASLRPPEMVKPVESPPNHPPNPSQHASASLQPTSLAMSAISPLINLIPHTVPPASTAVDQSSALPPTQTVTSPIIDGLHKPTCSLNLMCYRPGSQGCIRRQIQVVEKFSEDYPGMIRTDQEFFRALHREYEQHICGFWRRYLSLKTLRQIRLLSFTPTTRPEVVSMDDFTLQEIFYAYQHPENIKTEWEWIDWVFRLRQADRRHALEFVEGWSGFRIALIGSLPWIVATVVGVAWTARGGDAQTAFTVAAFILTVGTCKSTRSDQMPTSS
jgi:hypothetical protein